MAIAVDRAKTTPRRLSDSPRALPLLYQQRTRTHSPIASCYHTATHAPFQQIAHTRMQLQAEPINHSTCAAPTLLPTARLGLDTNDAEAIAPPLSAHCCSVVDSPDGGGAFRGDTIFALPHCSRCLSTRSLSCATDNKRDHLRPVLSRAVCVVMCRGCSLAHSLVFRTALWLRRCVALGARGAISAFSPLKKREKPVKKQNDGQSLVGLHLSL